MSRVSSFCPCVCLNWRHDDSCTLIHGCLEKTCHRPLSSVESPVHFSDMPNFPLHPPRHNFDLKCLESQHGKSSTGASVIPEEECLVPIFSKGMSHLDDIDSERFCEGICPFCRKTTTCSHKSTKK